MDAAGRTILLVEDESIIALAGIKALERAGYRVVHALSGERAVELAVSTPEIALGLMDINLGPGIDRSEAARRILLERRLPIIFLSSHAEDEYVRKVRSITRYGYVIKASGQTVLLSTIESTLELHRAGDADAEREARTALFDALLEHSPVFLFFKDEDIRAIHLSRNYEAMLGRPLGEILGKTMDDLFPSDLAKAMMEDDKKILREGRLVEAYEELGGRFYYTIKFPLELEGGRRLLAGFTMDVTERTLAERRLEALAGKQGPRAG